MNLPSRRILAPLTLLLALTGCEQAKGPVSLVGDAPAPGAYALAGDTITVWQRVPLPGAASRFRSYSITPAGSVEALDEFEQGELPLDPEEEKPGPEQRRGFVLPRAEFEAIRDQAALLRPLSLGPDDPVGGYGGEAPPKGCPLDKSRPRASGINFLNNANWGAFVFQPGCTTRSAQSAAAVMADLFARLDRAAQGTGAPQGADAAR